jgi:hypothetical protein
MPLTWRTETLNMDWCLSCHRDPVEHVRPRERLFDMEFDPASLSRAEREALAAEYGVKSQINCSICHR